MTRGRRTLGRRSRPRRAESSARPRRSPRSPPPPRTTCREPVRATSEPPVRLDSTLRAPRGARRYRESMILAAFAVAAVAALFHVYVFALESLLWTTDRARRVFGTTPADAQTTRVLAYNQGFYNLFLAVEIAAGIGLYATHHTTSGAVLVL